MGFLNPVDLLTLVVSAALLYGLTKIRVFSLFDIGSIRADCELEKIKSVHSAREPE
ncbi:MAG: hypothetical protein ACYC6L_14675 [Anaerolineae bacterium]